MLSKRGGESFGEMWEVERYLLLSYFTFILMLSSFERGEDGSGWSLYMPSIYLALVSYPC